MQTSRERLDCLKPAACLMALMMLTEGTAAVAQCPSRLSCLLQRRHPCAPRTQDCGPCLAEYQDDPGGKCVLRVRSYVPIERPKTSDPKQLLEYLHRLLTAPKSALPSGLKSSRKEWTTLSGGPKSSPEVLKMERLKNPSAGEETPMGDLKTPLEGVNTRPEEMKTPSKGKSPPEGLKTSTHRLGVQAGVNTTDALPTRSSAAPPPPNATAIPNATQPPGTTAPERHKGPVKEPRKQDPANLNDAVSLTLVVICTITGVSGLLVAALCWYRLQKEVRLAQKMAYTAYRGSRQYPSQRPGDARLAQSVQFHHYQHQKKKLQNMEENGLKAQQQLSTESEADNDGGEYTVYECPGLAPTGEMEIHNPLFFDSSVLHAAPGPPCQGLK